MVSRASLYTVGRLDGEAVVSVPQKTRSFLACSVEWNSCRCIKMHSPFALCAHLSRRWQTNEWFSASFTHSTVEFEPQQ